MQILIVNTVMMNGGDAAILQAEIDLLRAAFGESTEIVIQDDHPHVARQYYPDLKVVGSCYWNIAYAENTFFSRVRRWGRFKRFLIGARCAARNWSRLANSLLSKYERANVDRYLEADLVVATGGTYLVEQYDLAQRIFDMRLALLCERPLIWLSQSLGPFERQDYRQSIRILANSALAVLVRDRRSQRHLVDIGVMPEQIRVAADMAFALGSEHAIVKAISRSELPACPRIAISVREWKYFARRGFISGMRAYIAAIAALVTHLVCNYGAEVTFLSSCQGVKDYKDDSKVAAAVVATLDEHVKPRVFINGDFHTPSDLSARLKGFDVVVATRMHVGILALCSGVPVFPIAYEFKTEELFETLGYEHIVRIDDMDEDSLVAQFDVFMGTLPSLRKRIFPHVRELCQATWSLVDFLRSSVGRQEPYSSCAQPVAYSRRQKWKNPFLPK